MNKDRELMQRYKMALESVGVCSNINDAYRIVKKALEQQPTENKVDTWNENGY